MMIGLMLVMSKKKKKTLKRSNKNGCAGGVLVIHGVLFFLGCYEIRAVQMALLDRRYIQVYSCKSGE